ncbi:NADH-quinone oxidoreductase subunit N [Desulfolithobacter dissulfuricans]|uniref:NADH-quinone oxidoreductase subunit N n=1 Tax=Desulfolithobacter dissulfuricans TaxID=2795293 RepID=A0A915U964_9BACT|nr:NADH-quinone oxidoreductase subunit N [Desulfolithobacter dissulfuricans]BCO08060.1 NADH-quinone oxidoreductase subunit N [Desulfolithobacter dissulfuricans]
MAILPELTLLAAALAFFALSLTKQLNAGQIKNTAVFFGFLTFLASIVCFGTRASLFYDSYQVDQFSQLFKLVMGFALLVVTVFSQTDKDINIEVRPEYYMFLFLSVLGLMALVSSVEMISIFVSLELSSFALYLLVPMRDDQKGLRIQMEAGIKYILFGVMATGFMLYGMSYLFGLTGSTYLAEIIPGLQKVASQPAALFAVLMVLGGFFYKLAVFPMHFWVPDIYQGASNETTGFIATIPKLGAVAMLIRFVTMAQGNVQIIIYLLMTLALCSMFYGNLSALVQTDVKRMLGFSGISHAGFVLLGILTMQVSGYATSIYYIIGYVLMNLACFLVLANVSSKGENLAIEDLNGLHKREPVLAFILAVGLFALAGIPPFIGFMGKFMLLTGAFKQGYLWLVILAAINTAIAIYYYLSVVKAAYTADPEERPDVTVDCFTKTIGVVLVLLIIIMGVFPAKIVSFAGTVVQSIM